MSEENKEEEAKTEGDGAAVEAQPAELPPLEASSKGPVDMNIAPLMNVNLKVSVILGRTMMPLGELLKLGTGSVIELNTATGEPIDILVNDKLFAKGEIVVVNESFGIRIVEILNPQKAEAA